jgi:3-oxoacyl-[acyl-carrier protein] reductase
MDLPIVHESVPAEKLNAVIASIPGGRLGSADYIADVAVMLAAENAYFANGACWDVNGGLFMR